MGVIEAHRLSDTTVFNGVPAHTLEKREAKPRMRWVAEIKWLFLMFGVFIGVFAVFKIVLSDTTGQSLLFGSAGAIATVVLLRNRLRRKQKE